MKYTTTLGVLAALVLAMGSLCYAQQAVDLAPVKGLSSFGATEKGLIGQAAEPLVKQLLTAREPEVIRGAQAKLLELTTDTAATPEFRAAAGDVIIEKLTASQKSALAHANRRAMVSLAAGLQNPASVPFLLQLLKDTYPSVRYLAAKGLSGEQIRKDILRGAAGVQVQPVIDQLGQALDSEKDVIALGQLFEAVAALGTESATDLLINSVAKKVAQLDLSRRDEVEVMKAAVALLEDAYGKDIRAAAAGKQRIIATLVQILVQTPPNADSLELTSTLDETLGRLTKEKTGLAEAIKEAQAIGTAKDSKLFDVVWLEQLNWVEVLLKTPNQDLRLKERPKTLDWTPAKSAEAAKKTAA